MTPVAQNTHLNDANDPGGIAENAATKNNLLRVTRRLDSWLTTQQQVPGRRVITVPRNWLLRFLQRQVVMRFDGLERLFVLNPLSRLLVYLGFSPVHIFIAAMLGAAIGLRWLYKESRGLFITLTGIIYPTISTWRLLRTPLNGNSNNSGASNRSHNETALTAQRWIKEARRWLAYWTVFSVLQLIEHWNKQIQDRFAAYHPIKLILLYWLQCPVGRGAELLGNWRRKYSDDNTATDPESVRQPAPPTGHSTDTYINTSISMNQQSGSKEPSNVYAHNGDDWDVFKERLNQEFTNRPAWQNPQSVLDEPVTLQPALSINYADAVTDDTLFFNSFSSATLYS
ncbi:hypothetical protein BDF19DRAFT_424426 [Syncephalis fuscata]|nr:hypothetical protein BDF19DRAFT_424426 [Syncephalis fuscata]